MLCQVKLMCLSIKSGGFEEMAVPSLTRRSMSEGTFSIILSDA